MHRALDEHQQKMEMADTEVALRAVEGHGAEQQHVNRTAVDVQ
jgi:hypothetical protein